MQVSFANDVESAWIANCKNAREGINRIANEPLTKSYEETYTFYIKWQNLNFWHSRKMENMEPLYYTCKYFKLEFKLHL